jgi:hypothetical protein
MSYKYRVLADAPLGYWRLNEYVASTYDDADINYDEPGFEYNQVLYDRLYDETLINNQAFVSGGSSAIFSDVLPLTTQSNVVPDFAGCKVTDNTILTIRNRPNKYRMFYNGTENLSFGIEFWLSLDSAPTSIHNILTIYSGTSVSGKIYISGDRIYFEVFSLDSSYSSYKQIIKWDSQMHVFASFTGRKINISVNAMGGSSTVIPQSFTFALNNTSSMNVNYQIGPSATQDHFIINDLAFYDYVLSENIIKNHMVWASNDSKPQSYVKETSGYFFDIKDSEDMFNFKKEFGKPLDYQEGVFNNLQADNTGISIQRTATSQQITGTWIYQVPSSASTKIAGARISWDSGYTNNSVVSTTDFVSVDISYDSGATWKQVKNNYPAVQFADSSLITYPNILVKVTISTSDSSFINQPRLDNLLIAVYNDLSIYSDLGAFTLMPRQGSFTGDTYAIRKNMFNIMSRSTNFGIKLDNVDDKNSIAVLQAGTQSVGFKTLDFWFRYDDVTDSYNQYILDTVGYDAYIYFVGQTGSVTQNGFAAVYINGLDYTNQSKVLSKGEIYHFVCVYPDTNTSPVYFGGTSSLNQYSLATYGFFSVYQNAFSQTDAQNRYLSYLTSNTGQIGLGSNYMGSLAEFNGNGTDFNGGSAILSYTSPNFK